MIRIFLIGVLAALLAAPKAMADPIPVILATDDNHFPYAFLDQGKPAGIYVRIVQAVTARMPLYDVKITALPWKRALKLTETGDASGVFPPHYFPSERPYLDLYSETILIETPVLQCDEDSMNSVGFRRFIGVVGGVMLMAIAGIARAETSCASIPPMPILELKSMYSDSKGSVMNNANEDANAKMMEPIFTFFRTLERALDGVNARPGNPETDCAFQLFGEWAKAGALTSEPQVYEGQGKVKRGLLNPGFQMIGLKFRAAGYTLDGSMLGWLRKMDRENVEFYTKGTNRANQRVWAATGAALNTVLERDPVASTFQDQVWHEALNAIDNDGFIAAELERGQQALVYHIYSLSATVALAAARNALGYTETADEKQRVKKLAVAIGETLCDSRKMETLAKAKIRIPDGQWAYEVINGFGGDLLDANWSRCGLPQTDFNARDMGGDSRRSAAILRGLHS